MSSITPFETYHPALLAYVLNGISNVTLEESVKRIQGAGRRIRKLFGPDSILDRTLGVDKEPGTSLFLPSFNPDTCKSKYVDLERGNGKESSTEFGETKAAFAKLAAYGGIENALAALKEVGDIKYQEMVMRLGHAQNPLRPAANGQFSEAFTFLDAHLQANDLSMLQVDLAAQVTYAVRGVVLNTDKEIHKQPNKHKPFEFALLLYALKRYHPERFGTFSETG